MSLDVGFWIEDFKSVSLGPIIIVEIVTRLFVLIIIISFYSSDFIDTSSLFSIVVGAILAFV